MTHLSQLSWPIRHVAATLATPPASCRLLCFFLVFFCDLEGHDFLSSAKWLKRLLTWGCCAWSFLAAASLRDGTKHGTKHGTFTRFVCVRCLELEGARRSGTANLNIWWEGPGELKINNKNNPPTSNATHAQLKGATCVHDCRNTNKWCADLLWVCWRIQWMVQLKLLPPRVTTCFQWLRGNFAACVRGLTCAGGRTDGDQVGPVLRDGLDGQLVLTQRALLQDGDRRQRRRLGALDDAADSPYRGSRDGRDRLHFHWEEINQIINKKCNSSCGFIQCIITILYYIKVCFRKACN